MQMFEKNREEDEGNAMIQCQIMEPLREFKKKEYDRNPHMEELDYRLLVQLTDMSFLFAKECGMTEEEFISSGTLGQIFVRRPKSLAALRKIADIHPDVIEQYGKSYIGLIRDHAKIVRNMDHEA